MKDWLACVLLGLTLCPTVAGAQATIKELELKNGYDEGDTIASPLFDSTSSPALEVGNFEAAYDTRGKVVRRGGGNFFTRGPEYKLDENIDLAEMLSVALRDESSAMGFRRVPSEGDGWHIAGIDPFGHLS